MRNVPKQKPVDVNDWKELLSDGKWYTSKQLSLIALIKEVTARRWLQQGVGRNVLDVNVSGIVKRFKVKDESK